MPAVTFKVRWPDGRETAAYSPSTVIHQHLKHNAFYPVDEFLQRAETALNAASERVREVKGFHCSAAMDTLAQLHQISRTLSQGEVHISFTHTP
ncbi:MSMEG_0570 family nitrogen starvation response protein [Pseudomonas sp. OIL-1]|uniref:MSMEG_0570 family nitrogen starvation response protein n=1 Tax=Pseudomonas sp. OIL-1 TaxID=2706126 RepID=UPI0013A74A94|nr:MSMEG_0570 family nitrogen starvation response protein [Pseudomonas sp. OIL-1]QIB50715.1 MSMEG_0570 family nitrogen starvation response protein [Pseudomonas sp. OIL-1]